MAFLISLVLLGVLIGAFLGWSARSVKESLNDRSFKSIRDHERFNNALR